jgi:uncharacterized protein (DUF2252 family)
LYALGVCIPLHIRTSGVRRVATVDALNRFQQTWRQRWRLASCFREGQFVDFEDTRFLVLKALTSPLTHADRHALGLRARKQIARSEHARFSSTACPHSPIDLLRQTESDRIPHLLKIKHQRMAASAFGFFRGAVVVMAADLSCHPNTGLITQICGDAHVANLGAFGGAYAGPGGGAKDAGLVFDINDFDETCHGPFEYDLKRLTTSLLLAGRSAGVRRAARRDAVLHFAERYRLQMREFAAMPVLELARYQIRRVAEIDPMPAILRQAERATPQKSLKSLTEPAATKQGSDPGRIFRSDPPLLTRLAPAEAATVLASLPLYVRTLQPERRHFFSQYTARDVAFKVVGTGSIGLRDYCVYFEGPSGLGGSSVHESPDSSPHHDPLFLQIKEEPASTYAPYLPNGDGHTHQGHRVVDGQRAMQLTSDPFLGYTTIADERGQPRDYLVRQLNDHKATLDLKALTADSLLGYADICGELFARGHARAGDPVSIAAYLGSSDRFDHALLRFARAYADKTEHDWSLFKKSLKRASRAK